MNWNAFYVSRRPIVLAFEDETLVGWQVMPDYRDELGSEYYEPSDDSLFADSFGSQIERYEAMKKTTKRLKNDDLTPSQRQEIKHKIKKVGK